MRFCPYCDNILIPKHKVLYCKVCEKTFSYDLKNDEYTIIQAIKHDNNESTLVIKEGIKEDKITSNDREAFEDFFQVS